MLVHRRGKASYAVIEDILPLQIMLCLERQGCMSPICDTRSECQDRPQTISFGQILPALKLCTELTENTQLLDSSLDSQSSIPWTSPMKRWCSSGRQQARRSEPCTCFLELCHGAVRHMPDNLQDLQMKAGTLD